MIKISTQDVGLSGKSRHACARKAYIREHCRELGTLAFQQVKSSDNTADMFTKPLAKGEHNRHSSTVLGKRLRNDDENDPATETRSGKRVRFAD